MRVVHWISLISNAYSKVASASPASILVMLSSFFKLSISLRLHRHSHNGTCLTHWDYNQPVSYVKISLCDREHSCKYSNLHEWNSCELGLECTILMDSHHIFWLILIIFRPLFHVFSFHTLSHSAKTIDSGFVKHVTSSIVCMLCAVYIVAS
jgi:hypothetical protein